MTAADYLLEFNPGTTVSTSIVEENWAHMAPWRFSLSLNLCSFFIPFYLLGFLLVYLVLSRTLKRSAIIIPLLFSYGVIMGSPLIHGIMGVNSLLYHDGIVLGISPELLSSLIEQTITSAVMPAFLFHYLITWVIAPAVLFILIIRGKTLLPGWAAWLNPLVFLIAGMLLQYLIPAAAPYIVPGSINKGNALMFLCFTIQFSKICRKDS